MRNTTVHEPGPQDTVIDAHCDVQPTGLVGGEAIGGVDGAVHRSSRKRYGAFQQYGAFQIVTRISPACFHYE